MRTSLSQQTTCDLWNFLNDKYSIDVDQSEIYKIIDNNIGFIVDVIEEQALEVDIK
jgi:hypothetical protein